MKLLDVNEVRGQTFPMEMEHLQCCCCVMRVLKNKKFRISLRKKSRTVKLFEKDTGEVLAYSFEA